ncbi:MAG: flagellar motor switch protein FliG [Rhodospirillales bacterium]|nr:flagellar motor switch protein FliG [Rhodospirillales bacterium]
MAGTAKNELNGTEKAAVLMLSLGEAYGKVVWPLLDDEEIKEISQAMASLGAIEPSVVEQLFLDVANMLSAVGSVAGTFESTERLLAKILPGERVGSIMEEIRGPAGRTMWDKLSNVNEQVLSNYLKNEYPQTVAVVMSKIKPEHAARVLSQLPEEFASEVVMRMLRMESVQKEILDKVEQTLRIEFMSNLARTNRRDSHELIADIFNNLDRNNESKFLTSLEERDRDSAERIKALMFTFEDLNKLDASGVQTLLRVADKDKLGIALKGASDGLRDMFFQNMSERAGKILREDMEAMGPVRLRDVDEAQQVLVQSAKELAASGDIVLEERGDDELVY